MTEFDDINRYVNDQKDISKIEQKTWDFMTKDIKWKGKINILLVMYGMLRPILRSTLSIYKYDIEKLSEFIKLIISDITDEHKPEA